MATHPSKRSHSVVDAIGNTPLVRLNRVVPDGCAEVYVKLESFNPTGSYKDRMALSMIESAEARGDLRPGMTVVEWTGGSTGSSLAMVCAVKGYPLKVVTSDAFAREKLRTMQAFGAEVIIVHSDGGKITPDLFDRMAERAEALVAEGNRYFTGQMANPDNAAGYEPLGHEIAAQLDGQLDVFCGAVGSAGMLMGAARGLKSRGREARIVAFEPAGSPFLTTGKTGTHGVEGIGMGYRVPLLDEALCTEFRAIEEGDARTTARRLAEEEGIFVGTSSGLNVAGALEIAREVGPGKTVVTVAVDSGLKYLTGDLFNG